MNGADPPSSNRFRLLDPDIDQPGKRTRSDDFVSLPQHKQNDDHIPRYLIATAVGPKVGEEIRPLSSYNVFQIDKGLKHICVDYSEVSALKSGDPLIKTLNLKAAQKFQKATFVGIIPVKIASHKGLNTSQGRIFSRNIINLLEEELVQGLASQKVVEVKKIMKKYGDKLIPTGAAIVTFDLVRRPDTIKLGWERVRVQEYIPNPMRCRNCQRLGHTKNRCRNMELCKECATPASHEKCTGKYCINCDSTTHSSYDPACLSFLKHKAVNKIKIQRRCTVREAWKIYNSNPSAYQIEPFTKQTTKPTMAQIVKNTKPDITKNPEKQNETTNTKTNQNKQPNNSLQTINSTQKNIDANKETKVTNADTIRYTQTENPTKQNTQKNNTITGHNNISTEDNNMETTPSRELILPELNDITPNTHKKTKYLQAKQNTQKTSTITRHNNIFEEDNNMETSPSRELILPELNDITPNTHKKTPPKYTEKN